jgi:hypothetical protein
MSLFVQNNFHNIFGTNVTHLANSYQQVDFVWIVFHSKKLNDEIVSTNYNPIKLEKLKFHKQYRDQPIEYLTIFIQNDDSNRSIYFLCKNYQIMANHSYILSKSGRLIKKAFSNSADIDTFWIDENDFNHFNNKQLEFISQIDDKYPKEKFLKFVLMNFIFCSLYYYDVVADVLLILKYIYDQQYDNAILTGFFVLLTIFILILFAFGLKLMKKLNNLNFFILVFLFVTQFHIFLM